MGTPATGRCSRPHYGLSGSGGNVELEQLGAHGSIDGGRYVTPVGSRSSHLSHAPRRPLEKQVEVFRWRALASDCSIPYFGNCEGLNPSRYPSMLPKATERAQVAGTTMELMRSSPFMLRVELASGTACRLTAEDGGFYINKFSRSSRTEATSPHGWSRSAMRTGLGCGWCWLKWRE